MTTRVCERCKRLYRNSGLEFRESVGRFLITYPSDRTSREWLCRSHLEGIRQVLIGGLVTDITP